MVLLLDSSSPTPLYVWRLPYDNPSCVRLLLGGSHSGGKEGVLCLTRRGELLLLSVASADGDVSNLSPAPKVREVIPRRRDGLRPVVVMIGLPSRSSVAS